ncbi:MAG: hypothetical protein ACR2MP_01655 [Streptosporangiaceae bacterium]
MAGEPGRRDWAMLGRCFTDPVHADFTEIGSVAAHFTRDELVSWISWPEGNANAVAEARDRVRQASSGPQS